MNNLILFVQLQLILFGEQIQLGGAILGRNTIEANELQFPFIVSISKYEKIIIPQDHLCTGSLLTKRHVLTCAHCKANMSEDYFRVMAGSSDLEKTVPYKLKSWISYLQWVMKTTVYMESAVTDISIITLRRDVNMTNFSPPQISSNLITDLYGIELRIAGWSYSATSTICHWLKYATVNVLKPQHCQSVINGLQSTSSIMCSKANPYALLNHGDSGGPLFNRNNVIFGINQGRAPKTDPSPSHINIHISTYHYRSFITSFVNN